jgi:opacity protein-like surface antigen
MSFKHLFPILLLSSITLAASAAGPSQEISVGAGALSTTMFNRFTYYNDPTLLPAFPHTQVTANSTSISGEFYFGYAYNINKGFDIGVEIFYDMGGPEIETMVVTPGYVKNALSNTIGLRVLPGFNITPSTRVYAGVGYGYMETSISVQDTETVLFFQTLSATKKGGALFYTAGLETMIYTSLGIRAGYSVMNASQAIASVSSMNPYPGTAVYEKYKAKPSFSTFYLGGILRFGF